MVVVGRWLDSQLQELAAKEWEKRKPQCEAPSSLQMHFWGDPGPSVQGGTATAAPTLHVGAMRVPPPSQQVDTDNTVHTGQGLIVRASSACSSGSWQHVTVAHVHGAGGAGWSLGCVSTAWGTGYMGTHVGYRLCGHTHGAHAWGTGYMWHRLCGHTHGAQAMWACVWGAGDILLSRLPRQSCWSGLVP